MRARGTRCISIQRGARLVPRRAVTFGQRLGEGIEEEPVDADAARAQPALDRLHQGAVARRVDRLAPQPPQQGVGDCRLVTLAEAFEQRDERFGFGQRAQCGGKLHHVPVDRLRLAAEGIEPVLVEISGGEGRVPGRREPPRAVIEAFAGDVDIVRIEHAVDEPGQRRGAGEDEIEQAQRIVAILAIECA